MKTVVAFHAHPDDEALLTGGTLARLASEGHRVVIVVACDGVMGEATDRVRLEELEASAALLGAARVEHLGYADSGHGPLLYPDPPDRVRFCRAPLDEAAKRLAEIISEERADLLLSYDPNGGYGHRDHVRVHEVGALAASLTGVRLLEATLPREPVVMIAGALQRLRLIRRYDVAALRTCFTPRSAITHRIDVRRFASLKQSALAAHHTQLTGPGRAALLFRLLTRLPTPLFALLLGHEWLTTPPKSP